MRRGCHRGACETRHETRSPHARSRRRGWSRRRLRREILAGDLPPGARLREAEFAARYDVSRNTLREALHRLSRSGLVVHRPHRGITVAQPGREDVGEIFRIRRVLEPAGLRAVRRAEIPELRGLAKSIDRAAKQRNWADLVDRDMAFHAWLVTGAPPQSLLILDPHTTWLKAVSSGRGVEQPSRRRLRCALPVPLRRTPPEPTVNREEPPSAACCAATRLPAPVCEGLVEHGLDRS